MNPDGRPPPKFNTSNRVICGQTEAPSGPRFPQPVQNGGSASQDRPTEPAPPMRHQILVSHPTTFWVSGMALYTIYIYSDGRFRWFRCPLIVPVYQIINPAPTPSRPEINLMNASVMPPSVVDKREPGAEDEQNKVSPSDETEAQENLRKDLRVPSGPPSTWEKNLKFKPCEDCMAVLASLCSEVTEDIEEDRRDESKKTEKNSFLQYMEELYEDTYFVKNVESHINPDFLDALLSSDPEAFDLLFLEQQQQQERDMKRNSDPSSVTVREPPSSHPDETLQYLNADPTTIKSNINGQDSLENKCCSPLVPSCTLEEVAHSHMTTFPTHEDNGSRVNARRAACPYCCLLLDNTL